MNQVIGQAKKRVTGKLKVTDGAKEVAEAYEAQDSGEMIGKAVIEIV